MPPFFRIGQGYDSHRFAEQRDLWLCGIRIAHPLGLAGHSDADVAIHSLCDALLGAAALRDIGYHFPDTDPRWKGADSKKLLKEVCCMIRTKGWEIGNVDVTIITEAPKLKPHIEDMRDCLAIVMGIDSECVSVKATTNEKMGFTGRGEGIAALASALIYKMDGLS